MDEMKKRGIDIQLFAEGNEDATQSVNQTDSTQQQKPQLEQENTEVEYDDKDPMEVLKATAIQLGLNPDDVAIMTKKQLQSYVDSAITKAIKTREEKLKKQAEIEKMKEKGQYEQLLRQERKEALEDLKKTYLQAKGLPEEFGVLITVDSLADLSLTEAKEQLTNVLNTVAQKVNEIVEAKVSERLKAMEKGTFTNQQNIKKTLPDNPKEALKQLFEEKS